MRFLLVALLGHLAAAAAIAANIQPDPNAALEGMKRIPSCALPCIVQGLASSGCSAGDVECMCNSKALAAATQGCVRRACRGSEMLALARIFADVCQKPSRDLSAAILAEQVVMMSLTGASVVLRLLSNGLSKGEGWGRTMLGWDDAFIAMAFALAAPIYILIAGPELQNGLGREVWDKTADELNTVLEWIMTMGAFYMIAMPLIRVSVLFWVLRVFTGRGITTRFAGRWDFRKVLIWTMALNAAWAVVCTLVMFLQCRPFSYLWTQWDNEHSGECVNSGAFAAASVAININLDIWTLVLPISQIALLHLSLRRKMEIGSMFAIGLFVTIISCLRMNALLHTNTEDLIPLLFWSVLEISLAIICANVPALRVALLRTLPDFARKRFGRGRDARRGKEGSLALEKKMSSRSSGSSTKELPVPPSSGWHGGRDCEGVR